MDWICSNVGEKNCLTTEEMKKWRQIPKDKILEGEKLQEALTDLQNVEEKKPKNLDEVRDELELSQACVVDLKKVKSNLSNQQTRLELVLANLEKNLEKSESSLATEQKKHLRLNSDLETTIQRLKNIISEAQEQSGFVFKQDLSQLLEEDEKTRGMICQLIHRHFNKPLGQFIF